MPGFGNTGMPRMCARRSTLSASRVVGSGMNGRLRAARGGGNRRSPGGLGPGPRAGHVRGMSRAAIAVPLGLLGFLLYVGAAVALADHVLTLHWTVQVLYFILAGVAWAWPAQRLMYWAARRDRKSTRLNSSHANISYAVFCLKKKKRQ